MKRYYYNNKLAKVLLYFSTCHAIALGWFVLSKKTERETNQRERNHETTHALQWAETAMASGSVTLLLVLVFGLSPWWILFSGLIYYLWYVVEWLLKLPLGNAYRSIGFEQEAYKNEQDNNYNENRPLFTGWCTRVFSLYEL